MKKPFYKKKWLIGLATFLILGALASAISEEEPKETPVETPKETAPEEVIAKIGDKLDVGNVSYIVHDVSVSKTVGEGILEKEANGSFLIIEISITNNDDDEIYISSNYFELLLKDKTYSSDSTATTRYAGQQDGESIFLKNLNPDLTLTGYIVFDVTEEVANSNETKLQVQTGLFGTQKGIISLER